MKNEQGLPLILNSKFLILNFSSLIPHNSVTPRLHHPPAQVLRCFP
jgi:hypothetical protein